MWFLMCWIVAGDPLAAGKLIYETGKAPTGRVIEAFLPLSEITVDAALLPCASCHGRDGKGRPEGGLEPPDLRWHVLVKPYGHRHPNGRIHPAFSPRTLARAVTMGFDPAGNELAGVMPRYRLTIAERDALIAYIRVLGSLLKPGVHRDSLRLGLILPHGDGEAVTVREVARQLLDRVNRNGGLFRRRLVVVELEVASDEDPEAWRDRIRQADLFTLISVPARGREHEVAKLAANLEIPLIAPLIDVPPPEPHHPLVFYLHPGSFALDTGDHTRIAVRLLLHALRLCGRDLDREGLVKALESTYRFPTGILPPLSYGPNRRVGTTLNANHITTDTR